MKHDGRHSARGGIRWAVVGLGHFAQNAILPAFAHAGRHVHLTAAISDDEQKLRSLRRRYGFETVSGYDEMESFLRSGAVDAVYIAVPNDLHKDFVVRAAKCGVHVLCEKPMAVNVAECEAMIEACNENHVKLMIAYRLHFEKANMTVVDAVRSGKIGEPRTFASVFSFQVKEDNIRTSPTSKGGGPLYDIGVYCINAARYVFGEEPIEVMATSARHQGDPRFKNADEQVSAILRFPEDKLATFTVGFGAADVSSYTVVGTKGLLRLDPAYEYTEPLELERVDEHGKRSTKSFAQTDQVAAELKYFSDCILSDEEPEPSGEEGLHDVAIIEAVLEAARTQRSVSLDLEPTKHPQGERQIVQRPRGLRKPKLVHVSPPHAG